MIRVFGDSHTDALRRAAEGDAYLAIVNLHSGRDPADLIRIFRPAMGQPASLYVSMIGGNGHNVLGLIRQLDPWDFTHPERLDLPLEGAARSVDELRETLATMVAPDLKAIAAMREAFDGPIVHLESPPPVACDDFARDKLERYFLQFGSQPVGRHMRWKLWRLHSDVFRDHCERIGIDFIPAPTQDGFLHPDCYGKGPTHANEQYGRRLTAQINDLAALQMSRAA